MTVALIILAACLGISVITNGFLASMFLKHQQDLVDKALIVQTEQQEFMKVRREHQNAKHEILKGMQQQAQKEEYEEGWNPPSRLRSSHPQYEPDWGKSQPPFDPSMTAEAAGD